MSLRKSLLKLLFFWTLITIGACSTIHGSENSVRSRFLKIAPIGSSLTEVIAVAKKYCAGEYEMFDHGVPVRYVEDGRLYTQFLNISDEVIGVRSIQAYLGHYQGFPFRVDVIAHWSFDENDNLVDLVVEKQYDGL